MSSVPGWLIDGVSLLVGLGALAILVAMARCRLSMVSALVALILPTAVVLIAGLDSVARVDDAGSIPRGLPLPQLPDFGVVSMELLASAAAAAAIVLVQGAGVAESAPNPDVSERRRPPPPGGAARRTPRWPPAP